MSLVHLLPAEYSSKLFFHAVPMVQPSLVWGSLTSILSHLCLISHLLKIYMIYMETPFLNYILCSNDSGVFSATFLIFLQVAAVSSAVE